ncbi:MAG: hypothetical protein EVJ46_03125 [Candidatus Acididesulfobacter guangdongensis]|uniref:CN hydrolase domain-containing protein n=1 Tax=Acididesulfobacter guangdongensis TaxID=2597225 RepID=A0A519BJ08_ACIG2|nr:MAG: hypothetical protein EVJ46_03125 [Candidatus Acididesulfobacter guangdongensis]
MDLIKLSLAQIAPVPGLLAHNFEKHLEYIDRAKQAGSEIVIFPELSLTGYFLKDAVYDSAIDINDIRTNSTAADAAEKDKGRKSGDSGCKNKINNKNAIKNNSCGLDLKKSNNYILDGLLDKSSEIAIIAGFVESDEDFNFYNSTCCLSGGNMLHVHRKVYLPTYGMFEEMRYFKQGKEFGVFDILGTKASILTCEDAWHLSSSYIAVNKGAKLIIINSASPARGIEEENDKFSSVKMWEELLSVIAFYYKSYVVYVNRVGFEDGIGFSGGSCVFSPNGKKDYCLDYLDEGLLNIELNLDFLKNERFKTPILRDENLDITLKELNGIINK